MSAKVSLTIESELGQLEQVTAAVEEISQLENWPPELEFRVNLVLEELTVNIMNYGGEVSEIEISLSSESEAVNIEIVDDGRPFDPLQNRAEPDVTSPLEDRPIGGLGIHLVRTLTDDMRYRREQGKNRLALTTRWAG